MNNVIAEEEKDRTVAKLTEILDNAAWDKVEFID